MDDNPDPAARPPAQLARMARWHTVGPLVSAVAHELSQPLAAISMYSSAAATLVQSGRLEAVELAQVLQQIQTQVKRAGDL
ncbi:MAG TPA: histidine kinase dimerization/phospho-acceptor domain-containing protein, partial [Lamprocystis sp. (in: g-proteobacteria)]|nr:histidine kinase dimerization/phospho-acceptor domain-containing protein [Lamprocystis sp. (in: g-proteobacteria)]